MHIRDFLAVKIAQKLEKGEVVESHLHPKDFVNSKGTSLFETYRSLWDSVNEYDMKITVDNTSVKNKFNQFIHFPFKEVANIMSDYVRKLLRFQLRFLFLPYTLRQAEAVSRLKKGYPDTDAYNLIKEIIRLCDTLDGFYTGALVDKLTANDKEALNRYIKSLTEKVYHLPVKVLWVITPRVLHTLTVYEPIVKLQHLDVAKAYLEKYKKEYGFEIRPLEEQIVEDITQLSSMNLIHPDVYLALENALYLLGIYYGPVEASKLFIDNVEYKIKRYLAKAREELGPKLIDEFRNELVAYKQPEVPKPTVEELYQTFLVYLNEYQTYGENLPRLLEAAEELRALPYKDVGHLPGLHAKLLLVENINPFSTLNK